MLYLPALPTPSVPVCAAWPRRWGTWRSSGTPPCGELPAGKWMDYRNVFKTFLAQKECVRRFRRRCKERIALAGSVPDPTCLGKARQWVRPLQRFGRAQARRRSYHGQSTGDLEQVSHRGGRSFFVGAQQVRVLLRRLGRRLLVPHRGCVVSQTPHTAAGRSKQQRPINFFRPGRSLRMP